MTNPCSSKLLVFLSTPSARRATPEHRKNRSSLTNFYPRPPRGGRRYEDEDAFRYEYISIHALREEGDILLLI